MQAWRRISTGRKQRSQSDPSRRPSSWQGCWRPVLGGQAHFCRGMARVCAASGARQATVRGRHRHHGAPSCCSVASEWCALTYLQSVTVGGCDGRPVGSSIRDSMKVRPPPGVQAERQAILCFQTHRAPCRASMSGPAPWAYSDDSFAEAAHVGTQTGQGSLVGGSYPRERYSGRTSARCCQ